MISMMADVQRGERGWKRQQVRRLLSRVVRRIPGVGRLVQGETTPPTDPQMASRAAELIAGGEAVVARRQDAQGMLKAEVARLKSLQVQYREKAGVEDDAVISDVLKRRADAAIAAAKAADAAASEAAYAAKKAAYDARRLVLLPPTGANKLTPQALKIAELRAAGEATVAQRGEKQASLRIAQLKAAGEAAVDRREGTQAALRIAQLKTAGRVVVAQRQETQAKLKVARLKAEGAQVLARRASIAAADRQSAPQAWPSLGGSSGPHRRAGTLPAPPPREVWVAPPGWKPPSKPVRSWYDAGLRLVAPVASWYDSGVRLAPTETESGGSMEAEASARPAAEDAALSSASYKEYMSRVPDLTQAAETKAADGMDAFVAAGARLAEMLSAALGEAEAAWRAWENNGASPMLESSTLSQPPLSAPRPQVAEVAAAPQPATGATEATGATTTLEVEGAASTQPGADDSIEETAETAAERDDAVVEAPPDRPKATVAAGDKPPPPDGFEWGGTF